MNLRKFSLIAVLLTLAAPALFAQATRTWVSGVGDDVNPCSRTAPCKTFAGAISKTATGGEINALDSAGFGAVTTTKSITIDAGSEIGGVLHTAVQGVVINATSTSIVILRNLDINGGLTGTNGVRIHAAGNVHVENCTIWNYTGSGILDSRTVAGGNLYVKDTIIRADLGQYGIFVSPTAAQNLVAENVHITKGSLGGIRVQGASKAYITDCEMTQGSTGVLADSGSVANVQGTLLAGNLEGVTASGAGTIVRLSECVIVNNTSQGTNQAAGGVIQTWGNNRCSANAGNNCTGLAATTPAGQV